MLPSAFISPPSIVSNGIVGLKGIEGQEGRKRDGSDFY